MNAAITREISKLHPVLGYPELETRQSWFRKKFVQLFAEGWFTQPNFWNELLLKFKEVMVANQNFYGCQKNN